MTHNFNISGVQTVSNISAYQIEINQAGDAARVRLVLSYGSSPRPTWQQIKYTTTGRAWVRFYRRRLYLENFMRVN